MGLPSLVLVHGGGHAADCWDPTVAEIHTIDPSLTVLPVDLPGRRSRPGDLSTLTLAALCDESTRIVNEPVSRAHMPDEIPRTWILTMRDRALAPRTQRASIEALGGVQTVIEIDTCHNLMISEPARVAEILVERCQRHA